MTLTLPVCEEPEVSVIMVTHGAGELTERAISALVTHTKRPFELIVVDNGSDDETRARLRQLRNVRLVLNDENRGFGPANNQGAEEARGDYLVLLNTDAFVHTGWLDPLLEALIDSDAGAAIPRFLNPDGSLQEAGALLAKDGSVMAYGEGDDPELPWYRFPRTVDYGSAACMLLRRSTFAQVGGFDARYAPAYFEDVDLCVRLAKRGQPVVYQPSSTVTHVRHGSGEPLEATRLSERNHKLFFELRGRHLAGRPWTLVNASEQAVIAARDALATPRVLICAGAGNRAATGLADVLVGGWPQARITWATGSPSPAGFQPDAWRARGVEVSGEQDVSFLDRRLFHYDLVLRDPRTAPGTLATIASTQPQAPLITIDALAGPIDAALSRLEERLASIGIAPQSG